MSDSPTLRQIAVLRAVRSLSARHGYPPSIADLCRALGIRSTNGVSDHLKALERKGCITRTPVVARSIVITRSGFRWLNETPAPSEGR